MNKLGEKIKKRRKELRWSLDKLASESNISKAYLFQLETGESDRPSAEILYNLATALDLSIAELLGRKLTVEENDKRIPAALKKAAVANGWIQDDIVMLLGVAQRAKKEKTDLTADDWLYAYDTLKRILKK